MFVKKYKKLNHHFWRCNIVLSRCPSCTCTMSDTTDFLNCVNTTGRRMPILKSWSSETACQVLSSYDWLYKPLVNFSHLCPWQFAHSTWRNFFMNLTSVIITSSETFTSILLINEVSVVDVVVSRTLKFEKQLQY